MTPARAPGFIRLTHVRDVEVDLLLLFIVFAATNLLLLDRLGIRTSGDSSRYISAAELWSSGRSLSLKQSSYSGYILLIAATFRIGAGLAGVIAVQVLVAACAGYAQYRLGNILGGRWAGVLASILVVMNPDVQRWNYYVLTDSLYISLVALSCWFVYAAEERRGLRYALAFGVTLLAALVRPNGWLLPPIAFGYWLQRRSERKRTRAYLALGVVVACLVASIVVPQLRARINVEQPYEMMVRGVVVWGWQERMDMPAENSNSGDWVDGLGYVGRHPGSAIRLAAARVGAEAAHVRPFYSRAHNTALLAFLVPLYVAALIGGIRRRSAPIVRLIGAIVIAHFAVVALTFADWDGRFLLYVLPLVSVLAASQMVETFRTLRPAPLGRSEVDGSVAHAQRASTTTSGPAS